jgi:hypothetical protein
MKVEKQVRGKGVSTLFFGVTLFLYACGGSTSKPIPPMPTDQGTVDSGSDQGTVAIDKGPVSTCPSDHCDIDGLCHPNGSPNPNNACQQCLVVASNTEWTDNDAGICDDGKACTTEDFCDAGSCSGLARDCEDNDVCTEDSCEDGLGCTFESKASDCADDNPCTDNSCDPVTGCVVDFNTLDCDDGSACSEGDQCADGQCVGAQVTVDDNNPCTDDGCDPDTGLFNTPNTLSCNDGDECTVGDACTGGDCQPGPDEPDCDDDEYCTDDGCDSASGCYNQANLLPCTDGLACTVADFCSGGSCLGSPKSCNDNNDCTTDSCSEPGGCSFNLIVSDACRPSFWGIYPNRGATVQKTSGSSVTITGHVDSGAGPITSLTINGTSVSVASNGAFTYVHDADYGNNIIVFEATDDFGSSRRRVQSFLLSNEYLKPTNAMLKNGTVDPGIGIFIGQEVIDDGFHGTNPVDDLATIFEMVLNDFDLNEVVPPDQPVGSAASYDIFVYNFNDLYRTVSLSTDFGVIEMEANIYFPSTKAADIKAESWLPDVHGELYLDRIQITADITTNVVNHQIVTDLINVNVEVYGLDVDLGWLVNWLVNFFEGYITNKVETEFEAQLAGQLGPMIGDALGALAFETTLNLQSIAPDLSIDPIDIFTDPSSMIETPSGIDLKMRVGAYGGTASFTNKGAPKRNGCGWGSGLLTVPKTSPLAMVVSDDAINVLLYSAWRSGLLEFEAPTEMLGASTLIDQGISDLEVTISGMLAPIVSDCGPAVEPEVQLGDLRADVSFELFGQPATMTVYASMAAEVEVVVEEVASGPMSCVNQCGYTAGKPCQCDSWCVNLGDCCTDYTAVCVDGLVAQHTVSLAIGDVNAVEMEVVSGSDVLIPFEQVVMDALNEELVPSVLGAFSNSTIGGFPLPSIDVGGLAPGVPAGTLITLDPQNVQHSNGKIIITGDVQ